MEKIKAREYYVPDRGLFSEVEEDDLLGDILREALYPTPKRVSSISRLYRQKVQQGYYLIFPNVIEDGKIIPKITPLDKYNDESIYARIQIASTSKKQIMRDLRALGISKEFLFQDSGDIVAAGLKERYEDYYLEKGNSSSSLQR